MQQEIELRVIVRIDLPAAVHGDEALRIAQEEAVRRVGQVPGVVLAVPDPWPRGKTLDRSTG